jgi:hypothetical protein
MKSKKKVAVAIVFASTALALYALSYYVLSVPHSHYAAFGLLAIFAVDIIAWVLADALDDRNKPN